jgi:hypothetical protein
VLGGGGGSAASPSAAAAAGTAAPGVAELAAQLERAAVTDTSSSSGASSGPAPGGTTTGSSSASAGRCYFTHLVLDCDGVLVDSERTSCEALRLSILQASAAGPSGPLCLGPWRPPEAPQAQAHFHIGPPMFCCLSADQLPATALAPTSRPPVSCSPFLSSLLPFLQVTGFDVLTSAHRTSSPCPLPPFLSIFLPSLPAGHRL